MKFFPAFVALLLSGCATPNPPKPPSPPVVQTWTNAARLPAGQLTTGIAIYLPRVADAALTSQLVAAGAVKRSETAWTINPFDRTSPLHRAALEGAGRAGASTGPFP